MSDGSHLKSVMILDDDADFRKLLLTILGKKFAGVNIIEYDPVAQGVPGEDFDWTKVDVLLLDYYLCIHGVTGLDILQKNRKNKLFPATIMLTGAGNEEVAVRAVKAGVYDYLRKETLDKEHLHSTILKAFEEHKVKLARLNELTSQSHAFNKALFYQELEQKKDNINRVLILIELDNHETLEKRLGIILRDNIIRHIAKQSFEIFKLGNCNPSITRFADTSIALLIDDPGSRNTMEFNLRGLCSHLNKHQYKLEGKKIRTTVSIGALFLAGRELNAEEYIKHVRLACAEAATQQGDSFYIYSDNDWTRHRESDSITPAEAITASTRPVSPAATAPVHAAVAAATVEPQVKPEQPVPTQSVVTAATVEPQAKPGLPSQQTPEPDTVPSNTAATLSVNALQPGPKPGAVPPVTTTTSAVNATKPGPKPGTVPPPRPAAQKSAPAAKPAKAALPEKDEDELERMELSAAAQNIKKAFAEKRAVQIFQPVIPLSDDGADQEVYIVSVQLINKDGSIVPQEEFDKETNFPAFRKFIDRWMLREIIGRLVGRTTDGYVFFLKISHDSLADANFFNWLRKLLKGLEKTNPGKNLLLEMSAREIQSIQKQAGALMSFFKKSHGFRYILAGSENIQELENLSKAMHFDLIRGDFEAIANMNTTFPDAAAVTSKTSILRQLKNNGVHIIVDDVVDATKLTDTITLGADYAAGSFIGEPVNQLDDVTNVETFEII